MHDNIKGLPPSDRQTVGFVRQCLPLLLIVILACSSPGCGKSDNTGILWDNYGVPHIYARNAREMYYAFGWSQMNSHANLILRLYAQARGKAAEYFGEGYVGSDKKILLFDLPGLAGKFYRAQDKEYRSYLDAFVQGLNDYAKQYPDSIGEDYRQVLPVRAEDVISHTIRVISLEFLASGDIDAISRLITPGSNSMAIAPSKSASGNAMLISNPHLPWGDFFTWFEAHLNSPGFDAYGAALAGMPVLTIAFNNYLGWTHTVNTIDASDRYALTLKDDGYLLDGKTELFDTREVTIKVRQKDNTFRDQKFEFKYSKQGPVVGEKGEKAYAVRIAGLTNTGIFEQYHRMCKAVNLNEFESALRMLQNPMFNVVYADKAGNILYLFNGDVPVRPEGDFAYWHGTVDGTRSELIWNTIHGYDELPRVLNPPSGFVQNCNDAPWVCTYPPVLDPSKFPPYMSPLGTYWRAQRALNMVRDNPSVSFDQLVGYKLNTGMEVADRFLGDLLKAAEQFPERGAAEAASVLKAWDRKTDTSSRGAVLFAAWWDMLESSMFEVPWTQADPLSTPRGLKDKKKAVDLLVKAAEEVKGKYGKIDIAWGDVNRFRAPGYDFPANGGPDRYGIFRAVYFVPDKDNKTHGVAGDSYVAVTEFGEKVRAKVLLSYGNSSRPGNRHAGDQLGMMSRKVLRPALLDKSDILQNLERREVLTIK